MNDAWAAAVLQARDDNGGGWWYSREGYTVRWALFIGVVALIIAYLFGGYYHATRRIRKGLLPLRYHRWMIKRTVLAQIDPRYAPAPRPNATYSYATYRPADAYGMGSMPPPPVYDPSAPRPPAYSPPEGGSKVNPTQQQSGPSTSQEYAPPPGPPPSHSQQQQ
ncbi:hypothetical protein SODALDRAFT_327809 [Sodiomyces alkalinus F11]|uniref:Ubiquitin-protein ligase sel1 n=1 Tax=Sodiomyces alkalinus (strain CBS 110278 / VKM F-3762 / F11) TaxID=1314773 RepID=A0A3N2QA15_SODAK|nr:hypothetical protein SODALDRAFT_327809 [Sodiomyces alkalinus F11]ROT43603.1 hypothetical protein SODALDRAFT_327809 [Sodiomyces alkalinus F11]